MHIHNYFGAKIPDIYLLINIALYIFRELIKLYRHKGNMFAFDILSINNQTKNVNAVYKNTKRGFTTIKGS